MAIDIRTYNENESDQYTTVVQKLSENNEIFAQGYAIIRISPFGDYYMFTIYREIDGQNIPMDLTTLGTLYLNFYDESEEISVKSYRNTEGVDSTQGEVMFKVNKTQSKKILGFKNNTFYITNRMELGEDASDESVIYSGIFYKFSEADENALKEEFEKYKLKTQEIIALQNDEIENLQEENDALVKRLSYIVDLYNKQKALNAELQNQIETGQTEQNGQTEQENIIIPPINTIDPNTVLEELSNNIPLSEQELENIVDSSNKIGIKQFQSVSTSGGIGLQ